MTQSDDATTALLLLDYQVGLCQPGDSCLAPPLAAEAQRRGVLDVAADLLARARTAGAFVAHVGIGFDETYELRTNRTARFDRYVDGRAMLVGSTEGGFMPQVKPQAGEPVFHKGSVDPFVSTPLRHTLASHGVERVVLTGVATNLVVESTARHAADTGLQVVIAEDACASFDPDLHDFAVTKTLPLFGTVTDSTDVRFPTLETVC